jgi:hypothetical protein
MDRQYYNCQMRENTPGSKLLNISEEIYHNLCDQRSASEVMRVFGYPTVRETCFECLGKIGLESPSMNCSACQRGCHSKCLEALAQLHYEVRKRLTTSSYECLSCIDFNRCLECKNCLELADAQVYSCSICLRKTHQRCFPLPAKVIAGGKRREGNLKQIVCFGCLTRFGIKETIDSVNYGQKDYLLVLANHPSPTHFAWIEQSQLINLQSDEVSLLVSSHSEVEAVLSLHVPPDYAHYTIDKLWELLR